MQGDGRRKNIGKKERKENEKRMERGGNECAVVWAVPT
jgi:hypothetical protein